MLKVGSLGTERQRVEPVDLLDLQVDEGFLRLQSTVCLFQMLLCKSDPIFVVELANTDGLQCGGESTPDIGELRLWQPYNTEGFVSQFATSRSWHLDAGKFCSPVQAVMFSVMIRVPLCAGRAIQMASGNKGFYAEPRSPSNVQDEVFQDLVNRGVILWAVQSTAI